MKSPRYLLTLSILVASCGGATNTNAQAGGSSASSTGGANAAGASHLGGVPSVGGMLATGGTSASCPLGWQGCPCTATRACSSGLTCLVSADGSNSMCVSAGTGGSSSLGSNPQSLTGGKNSANAGGVLSSGGTTFINAGGVTSGGGTRTLSGSTTASAAGAGGTYPAGGATTAGGQFIGGNSNAGGTGAATPAGGGTTIDLTTGGTAPLSLGCQKTALTDVNVYVIGDATPSGADVEGNLYVGGNLAPVAAGCSIGAKDTVDCTTYSLVVGGNASNAVVKGGKAAVAGTLLNVTDNDCGGVVRASRAVDFATLATQVKNLSASISNLTPNCTASCSTDATGVLTLTGTDPTLNVCNIDGSDLAIASLVKLSFPPGSTVAVNVSGTVLTWGNASACLNDQCSDSSQADYVVWNMYQATSLYSQGIAIEGSVLAPLANLDGSGGHIAGQVIVNNMTGGLEYHPYHFNGCLAFSDSGASTTAPKAAAASVCAPASLPLDAGSTTYPDGGSSASVLAETSGRPDATQQGQLYVGLAVCNIGGSELDLNGYTVKYWYTEDAAGGTQSATLAASHESPIPTVSAALLDATDFRVNASSVMTLKFGAVTVAPGNCTGPDVVRIYSPNYCCYDAQAGDYSYLDSITLMPNPHVTVYDSSGLLVWGTEPAITYQ